MASFDIFNDDAFSLSSLTQTIIDIPRVPTVLGDSGLFNEYGIDQTTMMIERQGSSLSLVPTAPRGGVRQPIKGDARKLLPVAAVHLPQSGALLADQVQNVRAFGKETEVDAMGAKVKQVLAKMKGNNDLTLEYHRVGALMGQVLDTDGSVILDMYTLFGMTQETVFYNMPTAATVTDLKAKGLSVKRKIRAKLGGRAFTAINALVSEDFFDKLTGHNDMKKAWELWQQGQYLRENQSEDAFVFAGITYKVYSGGLDGADFIPSGTGFAYPVGIPGLFQTAYAPGDYMETVNTTGLPYYAKQERMPMDKGVAFEAQSNPINLCTLPEVVIKLSAAAS